MIADEGTPSTNPKTGTSLPGTGLRLSANAAVAWLAVLLISGAGTVASAGLSSNTPHREVYWGVERAGWTVYPLLAVLVTTLLYLPFRRARLWRIGRPDVRTDNYVPCSRSIRFCSA